jgi:hypothetical protein
MKLLSNHMGRVQAALWKETHICVEMERESTHPRRSSYLSGCATMSPSCFPVHEETGYSRIHCCSSSHNKRSWRWRNLLRRLVRDGKNLYGSKPLSFHYDAVSYSQNFDDGCHNEVPAGRHHSVVFQDVRWDFHE